MNFDASIADDDLMAAFESAALPAEAWNHRAHVRVAFALARQFDFATALARMRGGLYALNMAHRVPDEPGRGYHHLLDAIATHRVADRPDRYEPRLMKRHARNFAHFRKPRAEIKRDMAKGLTTI